MIKNFLQTTWCLTMEGLILLLHFRKLIYLQNGLYSLLHDLLLFLSVLGCSVIYNRIWKLYFLLRCLKLFLVPDDSCMLIDPRHCLSLLHEVPILYHFFPSLTDLSWALIFPLGSPLARLIKRPLNNFNLLFLLSYRLFHLFMLPLLQVHYLLYLFFDFMLGELLASKDGRACY